VWTDVTFRLQGGFDGTGPTNVTQTALFGELTYALSPQLSLTGGLRSFKEKAENVGSKLPSGFAPPGTPSTLYNDQAEFSATTPRLNMLWRYSPKGALYATASKGFRSGGFNSTATPRNYGPEDIVSVEIGNRGSLFGDVLQYEVAAYHSKYSNVQAQDLAPGCTPATCQALTVNSGKASGPGLDITLSAALTKSMTLDVALGYSDLTYDVKTAERNQGDPLNFVPKKTTSVSLSQRFSWAAGLPGMVRLDYQHSDPVKFIVRNQGVNVSSSNIDTLNARIGLEMRTWQVYLEGKNLTNSNGVTFPGIFGLPDSRVAPRSIGVLARAQF
jgi:outer membrane receptor protein involved in Fe transport